MSVTREDFLKLLNVVEAHLSNSDCTSVELDKLIEKYERKPRAFRTCKKCFAVREYNVKICTYCGEGK